MRVVIADLEGVDGFVNKDRVAGGYGNRLRPFSRTTRIINHVKRTHQDLPSVQMAYVAAICERAGHEVAWTRDAPLEGDVALVLSSLVDYRREVAWADTMRARGIRVGFVGLAASKLPHLFADHADFVVLGEPEAAVARLADGEHLVGLVHSPAVIDLDALPFPRWDLAPAHGGRRPRRSRQGRGGFPLLASRGCPEHCTYCSHRILAEYRVRSVGNVVDEIEQLASQVRRPYLVFRDPLFTEGRDRCLALCDEIEARHLRVTFECESRPDRLDAALLRRLHRAGLRRMVFGVESVSPATLRKVGRPPTPPDHLRVLVNECRELRIGTVAMFILGFPSDDWQSIAATIYFAIDLDPTVASFKLLTPYPATPLWTQMQPLIFERDLQKFDGFTLTFNHPNLTERELRFLLGSAYARFYIRPSYAVTLLKVRNASLRRWVGRLDAGVSAMHDRIEMARMSRTLTC